MQNIWINFRITTEEKERLKKDAHRHEMTVTEYLKWLIEKERGGAAQKMGQNEKAVYRS